MDTLREQAFAADEADDLPRAFELFGKLAETDTDGIPSLRYGVVAMELAKWDVAESALTNASRLLPRASVVTAFLGTLWAKRTDREETHSLQTAKHWYLKSLERKRSANSLTLLGVVCVRLDEIPEAKAAFEEAILIDPRHDEAMYNLAVLEEEVDPERCVELLRRAVEIDPDYAIAHQLLGVALQRQGNRDIAEQHFRKCLEIDPDDYFSNLYLANLLGVLRRNDEAEQVYRHAIELETELDGGFKFFANFLDAIGKSDEASEVRSRAAKISSPD